MKNSVLKRFSVGVNSSHSKIGHEEPSLRKFDLCKYPQKVL